MMFFYFDQINIRLYMWSGRDGYRKVWNNQVFNFKFLEWCRYCFLCFNLKVKLFGIRYLLGFLGVNGLGYMQFVIW